MTCVNTESKGCVGVADAGEADRSHDGPRAHAQESELCCADDEDPSPAFLGRFDFLPLC